jgi:hypothetical protein
MSFEGMSSWQKFGNMSLDPLNLSGRRDKKEVIRPYGALNPEQIALTQYLGPQLLSRLKEGPQYYSGELSAEMTPEEAALYNPSRVNLLSGTLDTMLNEANDPTAYNERFNREVATPTYQDFNENQLPSLLEGYSSFSTAAGQARANALAGIGRNLMTQRFAGQEAAKDRALNAYGKYADVGTFAAVPRVFKQAGLDRTYQEYIRGNEAASDNINKALGFLGISTGTYQGPQQDNRLLSLVGSLASIVSSIKGGGSSSAAATK